MENEHVYIMVFPTIYTSLLKNKKMLMRFNRFMKREEFERFHKGIYFKLVHRSYCEQVYMNILRKYISTFLSKGDFVRVLYISMSDFNSASLISMEDNKNENV